MSSELIQSTIYLTKDQREYVKEHFVNLSRLTRASVDNLIKREGVSYHTHPSKNPNQESQYDYK